MKKDLNELLKRIDQNNKSILNNFIPDDHKIAPAMRVNVPLSIALQYPNIQTVTPLAGDNIINNDQNEISTSTSEEIESANYHIW